MRPDAVPVAANDPVYEGPCKIPCEHGCDVPAGVTLTGVPVPRHAWGDVAVCPHDCGRAFLIVRGVSA